MRLAHHQNNNHIVLSLFTVCLMLLAPFAQAESVPKKAEAQTQKEEVPRPRQEMNVIGEVAFQQALVTISKTGGIYPYAYLLDKKGRAELMGFQGKLEERPSPEKMAPILYNKIRNMVIDENIVAAALVRPHTFKDDKGIEHQGIWALIDHRDHVPWVMLLPYVIEDGKLIKGEMIYQPTSDSLFPEQTKQKK